jgi:hypothetical protein
MVRKIVFSTPLPPPAGDMDSVKDKVAVTNLNKVLDINLEHTKKELLGLLSLVDCTRIVIT